MQGKKNQLVIPAEPPEDLLALLGVALDRPGYAYPLEKGYFGANAPAEAAVTDDTALSARFIITTEDEDREGDIIIGKGLDWTNFTRNPAIFFDHHTKYPLPIAKGVHPDGRLAVELDGQRTFGTAYFNQDSREAVQIYKMVQDGFLNMASISLRPGSVERRKASFPTDPRRPPLLIKSGEVMEWSVVGIGANPHALRAEVSKGMIAGSPISDELRLALAPLVAEKDHAISPGVAPEQIQKSETPAEPIPDAVEAPPVIAEVTKADPPVVTKADLPVNRFTACKMAMYECGEFLDEMSRDKSFSAAHRTAAKHHGSSLNHHAGILPQDEDEDEPPLHHPNEPVAKGLSGHEQQRVALLERGAEEIQKKLRRLFGKP